MRISLSVKILLLLQKQQPPCEMEGRDMRNSEELSALGVKDEDLILIVCNAA
ncbi:hypothetical protein PRUPE_6G089200 [Prunus persica]|uniref:Ubiquitin-like domain-containing protein n=1 Tax=Prunus persica TaxID=3760 RepID=A0A251NP22_PRUPE|nr:hypothetical protein PRUPE_6G089200 [Prunus persica]